MTAPNWGTVGVAVGVAVQMKLLLLGDGIGGHDTAKRKEKTLSGPATIEDSWEPPSLPFPSPLPLLSSEFSSPPPLPSPPA